MPRASLRFCALRAFAPSCITRVTRLCSLRAVVPCVSSHLTCLTHAPYLRKPRVSFSCALRGVFVHLKIFLGWIYSPEEVFHFLWILKGTTNRAVFMCVKNSRGTF